MNILRNKSGIILVAVMGVMAILTVFALNGSQITSTQTRYIDKEFSRLRAMAGAWAGVNYALNLMTQHPSAVDSPWQRGVSVDSVEQAKKYFHHVVLTQQVQLEITISDQASRLNLNAINEVNQSILARLIKQHGSTQIQSDEIAAGLVEWVYKIKKTPIDDIAELLMVKGVSQEIFDKIKEDITIYPKRPLEGLKVNYWTVSDKLFQALIQDIIALGKVENVQTFLSVAQKFRTSSKKANPDAIELAMMLPGAHVPVSTDYQVVVDAYDALGKTHARVVAMINKDSSGAWQIERMNRM